MSENVYILGLGMIKFGKHMDKGVKQMIGESPDLALKDCGFEKDAIEAAMTIHILEKTNA
jgi:acetyl-CoA acetyltransferase